MLFVITGNLKADDKEKQSAEDFAAAAAEAEKMMKKMARPGPQHKLLAKMAGSYKTTAKSYWPNPEEPEITEGSARFRLIMGGRFVLQNYQGTFDGKKFNGMGMLGYDKFKKKYTGTWVDTMNTSIMHTEGTWNDETDTLTETAVTNGLMGPQKVKMVTKHISDDKFTFTMLMVMPDGSEMPAMEITYERSEDKPKE